MLTIAALVVGFATLSLPDVVRMDFAEVRAHIDQASWKRARNQLNGDMLSVIKDGGSLDGGDLVQAIRLRAVIEAGAGHEEDAAFWWHIGLNLHADKAESALTLLPDEKAAALRAIQVRAHQPPEPRGYPKGRGQGRRGSSLYTAAGSRFHGEVKFEGLIDGPRVKEPLLVEATVPTAGVYAALEELAAVRLSARSRSGPSPSRHFIFKFRGR